MKKFFAAFLICIISVLPGFSSAKETKDDVIWLDKNYVSQVYVTIEGPYPLLNETFGFTEGLAPIGISGGKTGYIDKNGNLVFEVPGDWSLAYNFHEGVGCSMQQDRMFYFDKKGKILKEVFTGGVFSEGLCPIKEKEDSKWTYVDKNFKPVFTIDYDYPGDFKEGLAVIGKQAGCNWFCDFDVFKYGYMDKNGKVVIPPKYDGATDFKNGVAKVFVNDKPMYIDKKGNVVKNYKPKFDLKPKEVGNKVGFVNSNGKMIIPAKFRFAKDFKEDLSMAMYENKLGYINKKGEFIISPKYDYDSGEFSEGVALVKKDGRIGILKNPMLKYKDKKDEKSDSGLKENKNIIKSGKNLNKPVIKKSDPKVK